MAVQIATVAAVCAPSNSSTFTCQLRLNGGMEKHWRPIPGGVQAAVSAPGYSDPKNTFV